MKYRIDTRYVWFNKKSQIVLMYFMESVPFTFDDIPEEYVDDTDLKELADIVMNQRICMLHHHI